MHGVSKWFMVFTWHYYQSSLFSKYDVQPIMKCLWIIVVSVCGYLYGCTTVGFHWNYSLCVQFHSSVHTGVHSCVRCSLSFFWLCIHSLYHPWPSTEKGSGGLPRVHRLLCGLPRVHRGLRTLLPGTPQCSDQAVTTAASWVDGRAAPLRRRRLDRCGVAGK